MDPSAPVLLNRLLARARFRHLQALVKLAELGSVRRAAQAIGLTQPAVTQLLADLEQLLGVPLFHRHARGVLPTAVCRDLLPLARQSLGGLGAAAEVVVQRAASGRGLVRIWASIAAIHGLLVRALPAFNRQHPGIQLQLRECDVDEQFMGIGRGEVELALCRSAPVVPEGWQFQPLMEDVFIVACAPGHRLARRRKLPWRALVDETWLMSPVDSAARRELDTLFAPLGVAPRVSPLITRVSTMTLAMLQQQPELLTLVPASVFRPFEDTGQLVRLRLADALPFAPLGMVLPVRDVPPATQALAQFLAGYAARAASAR